MNKLPKDQELQRTATLALIAAMKFELEADFEGGFRVHEMLDLPEVAIIPHDFDPEDLYLRAYAVEVEPGDLRMVIDDVVFETDEYVAEEQLMYHDGKWKSVEYRVD